MKIQILIPHYKEEAEVIKLLLDSIAVQQSINFNDIGVIICHDGEEIQNFEISLQSSNSNFSIQVNYPFEIKQIRQEHKGVSAARNACLDAATADYVMFCDIDDMFYSVCGLYLIFREIDQNDGFDSLISLFIEESRNPEDKKEIVYINHEMDSTFVHGKVHRRQYLIDNNIRWNEKLTIHEDSYFNILCQNLSEKVKYCPIPFYLWKWRDASVCRHDPKYILKTYNNMIDSNDALIDEFIKRGKDDKVFFYTAFMIFDAYYTMNKPDWINQENKEYRDNTELRFKEYFIKHKKIWDDLPINDKMIISSKVRERSVLEGMLMEALTIDQWLNKIMKL